jgi:hypothetical protein
LSSNRCYAETDTAIVVTIVPLVIKRMIRTDH